MAERRKVIYKPRNRTEEVVEREMPNLREPNVILIACGDLHLSSKPPQARAAESDWWITQYGYLNQLEQLASKHNVPIICTGDLFDKPNEPAEFINWALNYIPLMYAIPGNHDLYYGRIEDVKRTVFWTMVETKRIIMLPPKMELGIVCLHAFPYNSVIKPLENKNSLQLNIAVIHAFVWYNTAHIGASEDSQLVNFKKKLKEYDIALIGDNHQTFLVESETECSVFNAGGFMRRRIDEMDHRPCVGLIYSDGTIKQHFLDVSKDKFVEQTAIKSESVLDMESTKKFMKELAGLGDKGLDFKEAVKRKLETDKVKPNTKQLVLECTEGS